MYVCMADIYNCLLLLNDESHHCLNIKHQKQRKKFQQNIVQSFKRELCNVKLRSNNVPFCFVAPLSSTNSQMLCYICIHYVTTDDSGITLDHFCVMDS